MALGFSLGGCDSMRTAAYAGGGAAAAGALGAGIGYIASKGNVQTTAIAGAASAVGGAVIGGAIAGAGKRAKEKQREEGYQLGVSDAVKRQYWIARSLQMAKHNDAFYGLIKDYVANQKTLTDAQASTMIHQWADIQIQSAQTRKKFIPLVEKAIPSRKAALFFQIDRRLYALMDLQVSSQLPLMLQ